MAPRQISDDEDLNIDDLDNDPRDIEPADDENEPDQPDEPEDEEPEDDPVDRLPPDRQRRQEPRDADQLVTRGARRTQRLANENRELRNSLDQLRREFREFAERSSTTQRQDVQPRETAVQREQRRALMSIDERVAEDLAEMRNEVRGTLSHTQMSLSDQADKSAFDAQYRGTALGRKYADRVEEELVKMRTRGGNAPRESILDYLFGKDQRMRFLGKGERAAAGERVRRQTTRPGNPGSDTQLNRRQARGTSLEDRLANQPL
jgi:hypothetical protein